MILDIDQHYLQLPELKVKCVATYYRKVAEFHSKEVQIKLENHEIFPAQSSFTTKFSNKAHKGKQFIFFFFKALISLDTAKMNIRLNYLIGHILKLRNIFHIFAMVTKFDNIWQCLFSVTNCGLIVLWLIRFMFKASLDIN